MAEEASNPFDAVRKKNRAVWEQASGRKRSEELPNPFDAVRKKNRAVWEQASGRKPSDESRAIPPPTGRESPLEGADALVMVAALSAKLSALEARVDYIEDDFPEWPVMQGEGGGSDYASYFKVIDASDTYKQLELNIGGHKYKPREMSDGTLKAMWLALLLFSPEKGSVLSIDEPEMNLHPAWLKVIGRWLQRFSSAEQLFVSTHSPDLLDTFTEGFKTGEVALFVFGLGDKEMRRVEPGGNRPVEMRIRRRPGPEHGFEFLKHVTPPNDAFA